MRIKLVAESFCLSEKYVPNALELVSNKKVGSKSIVFDVQDILEFQLRINDEIIEHGLDNLETVNKLGVKLYQLYDEIYYQL